MIKLEHQIVGEFHAFTSPDVPGLYVADRNEEIARTNVHPTIAALARMTERRKNREQVRRPAVIAAE